MRPVYLICGVSGSGKSWVSRQLTTKLHYIPHDRCWIMPGEKGWDPESIAPANMQDDSKWRPGAVSNHAEVIIAACKSALKPVITECPHGERLLREQLEAAGIEVRPYFVIEPPITVRMRYERRERKPLPKNVWTRASTIKSRAEEWKAPMGSSSEILELLRRVPL